MDFTHHGGSPVHVNFVTTYSGGFDVTTLPKVHYVDRAEVGNMLSPLNGKHVAVYVGIRVARNNRLTRAVDWFCKTYGAVMLDDYTSNYAGGGGFRVHACSSSSSLSIMHRAGMWM